VRVVRAVFVIFFFAVPLACGAVERPSSLKELTNLQTSSRAELAKKASPGAWDEGLKYLRLSNEAMEEGNSKKADRLASLGVVQLKIAFAGASRMDAQERLETYSLKKQQLEIELEQARSTLKEIETLVERRKLRRQLEQVVSETRRLAAAQEEPREASLSKKEKKILEKARREIGLEIFSRIGVWEAVLEVFSSKGIFEANRVVIIDGEKKLASSALKDLDLAALQEHVEQVGMKARRLITEAWSGKDEHRSEIRATIGKELDTVGIKNLREDFGLIAVATFPTLKKLNSSKKYKALKSAWEGHENIQLVPLAQSNSALLLIIPIP